MFVAQIALTLSVQMVKNDSETRVISVISVWQVGIGWIQPREYRIQHHNCKLEDIVVAQIKLTLFVQMIKTTLLSV